MCQTGHELEQIINDNSDDVKCAKCGKKITD